MNRFALLAVTVLVLLAAAGAWANPVVSNVSAAQRQDGSLIVDITYDLAEPANGDWAYVDLDISTDGGTTWDFSTDPQVSPNAPHLTGDFKRNIAPGTGKSITWDSVMDLPNATGTNFKVQINATTCKGYAGPMVSIPTHQFTMGYLTGIGHPCGTTDNQPPRIVNLTTYYVGKYEVTRGEYKKFMDDGGYTWTDGTHPEGYWSSAGWGWKGSRTQPERWATVQDFGSGPFSQTMRHPVASLTWYEAEAYCNWLNAKWKLPGEPSWHLPTIAQWENAARSNLNYVYPWGDTGDPEKCNSLDDTLYPGYKTAPVGSYPSGASPYGCMDMAGNVSEWCSTSYTSSYSWCPSPATDPEYTSDPVNVDCRGGDYQNTGCRLVVYTKVSVPKGTSVAGFRLTRGPN